MVDIRQTPEYAKYLSSIGWKVERINKVNYFIKKFPLIGSVLKLQRPEDILYEDIKVLSEKYRAFQIIIEPKNTINGQWLMANGFKLSNSPYLPTKTLQLDLTKSQNQLLKEMKKDARNAINKNKIVVNSCNNLEEFRNAWKDAVEWSRYVPPLSHLVALEKSFGNNCCLYHCTSTMIQSGAIFLKASDITYYWQAFTNKEGRKLQSQYKIVWEGILWAKRQGAKIFDFEGIYNERFPNKSWLGFTHFKKSFGGYEVSYPGTFVKNLLPFGL
ncbi:hypothetical protein A2210_03435 [Candidatus Woesebacteria bacterium RIFOXYA1_FULL_40_18]|uniref:FemAB domain protein n=5 Tax=Candidatus Woeseibacteriota TaxID=1752722 RepID=A0A0G0VKP6_9BACT|nr:MAG: FemAB domain protein [Candidatus Woesebacteria bacterium GW2011_GWB1_40_101]KKR63352.1 MAG: FemAB domain protein [Candidatus Woesebacteria bacterium GW2011_GWA1_40_45]OGM76939.1 MAG: hypothetical protein A2210_03435 [Candidatus Woesebacteria bacterium RIFOXYA1_FULL_40_18]OGM81128.1 MAG: hypothetical protein A2361_01365 [Candidatus Woesebacteria bacterium RIFOXYB1_FULL_40_26]OGM88089.1 MAG: hypothetical protein A2614_00500 [Candidatus Woesebacteria bacterium RIFOXYD1_FULL_40_21]